MSAKSSILIRPRGSPPRVVSKKTTGLGCAAIFSLYLVDVEGVQLAAKGLKSLSIQPSGVLGGVTVSE